MSNFVKKNDYIFNNTLSDIITPQDITNSITTTVGDVQFLSVIKVGKIVTVRCYYEIQTITSDYTTILSGLPRAYGAQWGVAIPDNYANPTAKNGMMYRIADNSTALEMYITATGRYAVNIVYITRD